VGFKYSVITCTLTSQINFWEHPREVLETMAELGYDGVDLDAEPDKIPLEKFNEVREIAESLGLKVPAMICAWGVWHAGEIRDLASCDEATRQYAVDYTRKCIDLSATFDDPPMLEIDAVPPEAEYPCSSIPRDVLRANFIKSAREICEYAKTKNVPIATEPINRFEGYSGFMNSITEARSIADEVEGLDVLLDFFHVNIEDGPVTDTILLAGDKLKHVHLADSNRQAPGTGHIDWLNAVRALHAIGFDGYLSVDSIPVKPDWRTLLKHTIDFMKEMEKTVEMQEQINTEGYGS